MSCPTCDHTMQSIVVPVFWCPRCGTVLTNAGEDLYVPKLVGRVRQLLDVIEESAETTRLGIRESIGPVAGDSVGCNEDVQLRLQRDAAIRHLAAWCVAVEVNGTSWDDWDEFYKDCTRKNSLPEIRALLDEAIEAAKRARGVS